jgi:hypothetical protein
MDSDAIRAAIAELDEMLSAPESIFFNNRQVRFRSVAEIQKAKELLGLELSKTTANGFLGPSSSVAVFRRG